MKYVTVAVIVDREFVCTHYSFCIIDFYFRTNIGEFSVFIPNINDIINNIISIVRDVGWLLLFQNKKNTATTLHRLGALFT